MRWIVVALASMAVLAGACARGELIRITNGQGEIAGEVTTSSVILQSRLTNGRELIDGDLPGTEGVARFEVATSSEFTHSVTTEWLRATSERDFIVKAEIDGLDAGTRYYYRLSLL
jgi:alkaline phosphatase D